ncbi:MAG: hypothetical protein J0H42_05540 [Rhizobiales bacterium]|nr:hypothetical protein [Hyphomicrobiales bacterium]
MPQIRKGIFGSLAIALTLGAVQLAFAHDLIGNRQAPGTAPEVGVNRAAKSDRASVPAAAGQTRTIALQHNGLTDTSVLVRLPVAKEESKAARNPSPVTKPASKRIAVACEPPVSILTDVAKLLQPGRCVT